MSSLNYHTSATVAAFLSAIIATGPSPADTQAADASDKPLQIVVMDPLAAQLACDCVAGYAQRDYLRLGRNLQHRLGRSVNVAFAETLASPMLRDTRGPDMGCPL